MHGQTNIDSNKCLKFQYEKYFCCEYSIKTPDDGQ
jgi:hypothetical protein